MPNEVFLLGLEFLPSDKAFIAGENFGLFWGCPAWLNIFSADVRSPQRGQITTGAAGWLADFASQAPYQC